MDDWQTPVFLLLHDILFSLFSLLFLLYFTSICAFLSLLLPPSVAKFAAGFTGSVTALSAVCLFFTAANIF
ncbi:hypothetical protein RHGRI_001739 [Rhododendron griersonianum]|uniref:Dolichyl-diphosphooligosaccharide-protein glycosyltransferase subunit OST5 n=1 Tax=Rhododendron griersonianum TaxID=479676 RepID=A0AAV6LQ83_9ERIC|nr:hypothetical protein RHGRI_001739 [Rhododendron griersonianum]